MILLDRDGVLNEMVIDAEHGLVDSPLHVSQVRVIPGVPEAVAELQRLGYDIAVVTNQPSAAKGKTTRANLDEVHAAVMAACGLTRSFICFHRAEDGCDCRKPKPGMLLQALGDAERSGSWMVGDGVTDVQAGKAAGVRTAFLGPRKCDACKVMNDPPDLWVADLRSFVAQLRQ